MKTLVLLAAAALATACADRTETESSGALDTTADTTARVSVPDIDIGMTTDTVSVPTLGTQRDTLVIDKPVVTGRKPVEVKRPTIDVNKRP